MSRLLSNVLDKISENNNDYRVELKNLNSFIDEKTTDTVSSIVALSNYNADFSSMVETAKNLLFEPITKIIETYVIRDLRSVEEVNEQFVDKINDKLDSENPDTDEEKKDFINSLNTLLNEKYLEIVKIKRVAFFNEYGVNKNVEDTVNDFISEISKSYTYDNNKLSEIFMNYKKEIYDEIEKGLSKLSNLYLNNFINEVTASLSNSVGSIDVNENINDDTNVTTIPFNPVIPEIDDNLKMDDIPVFDTNFNNVEMPVAPLPVVAPLDETIEAIQPEPVTSDLKNDIPVFDTPFANENVKETSSEEVLMPIEDKGIHPMTSDVVSNLESVEPTNIFDEDKDSKKSYDVEEILKIAKSPVVTMPVQDFGFDERDNESEKLEYNEQEVVAEMIKRLNDRLEKIDERQSKYDEEEKKLYDDETFVKSLTESAKSKKLELDDISKSLDEKEKELDKKQKELEQKINNVLPFAKAVMAQEENS